MIVDWFGRVGEGWFVGWLDGWLIDYFLVGLLVGWLDHCLFDCRLGDMHFIAILKPSAARREPI